MNQAATILQTADSLKPLFINRLSLALFRNYKHLQIDFNSPFVVITGENGAGKTNLLEALSYLSPGRGLRRVANSEVTYSFPTLATQKLPQQARWSVHANISGAKGEVAIGTGLDESATRKIHIDKIKQKNSEALLEHIRLVWLTPAMDGLFTGAGRERRRFFDRLVLTLDPQHAARVRDFEKSMRARNQLLETGIEDSKHQTWLEGIESQMSQSAIAILFARRELLDLMQKKINQTKTPSPFPQANLKVEGELETKMQKLSAIELEDEYKKSLQQNRRRDRAAGRTLDGPHQSNFAVFHCNKNMPAHLCSTGEQKALLVGLLLSHIELVCDTTSVIPILLLDEIAAHLDEKRRSELFLRIEKLGCQCFFSGTDDSLFSFFGNKAQHLVIADGKVKL